MVVTIQTSKETAKIEALVEAATANIYGIYMEAGEREMSADRTETADNVGVINKQLRLTSAEAAVE